MQKIQFPLTLVLDRLRSAHNTGNIFRIAEAVGARELILCGYTPAPPHPKLKKTAMGADELVPFRVVPTSLDAVRLLRAENCRQILAAEATPESIPAWDFNYDFPVALILGNEALGIDPATLRECDAVVGLPMFGAKASINVGNAAAAIVYAMIAKSKGRF
jgi:tRNA G18 (ribose-2'-O)-methylase SpoU